MNQQSSKARGKEIQSTKDGSKSDERTGGAPFPQVTRTTHSSKLLLPVALVWGVSGSGKSRLVQQFCQQLVTDGKPAKKTGHDDVELPMMDQVHLPTSPPPVYILKGKHDEFSGASNPFSVIVQALRDFALQLDRIRSRVKDLLGDETVVFLISMGMHGQGEEFTRASGHFY